MYNVRNRYLFGGRDPTNFRPQAFFKEGYVDKLVKQRGPDLPFALLRTYNTTQQTNNIVAYSIYGTRQHYYDGLIHNILAIRDYMPGWTARIYMHDQVPVVYRDQLVDLGATVVTVRDPIVRAGNSAGMFWRFDALTMPGTNVAIYDAENLMDHPQMQEILDFFKSPGAPYMYADRTWPWPRQHVRAGQVMRKKAFTVPFDTAFLQNWPLREPFGADEYFTTVCIGEQLRRDILQVPYSLDTHFARTRVPSNLAERCRH